MDYPRRARLVSGRAKGWECRVFEKRQRGFTLIELMVTIGIMAILTALAVPSYIDFIDRTRLRGAADEVVSVIGNARVESVKNDRDVSIAFAGSGASWCLGASAAVEPSGGQEAPGAVACDCTDGASTKCLVGGERRALEIGAHPGVAIGTLPSAFDFDSKLGMITPLGTTSLTLTSPRGKYDLTVQVNALGQARLCVPSAKPIIVGVDAC